MNLTIFLLAFISIIFLIIVWNIKNRKFQSTQSVSNAYDTWTNDRILEKLWGEHIHLGFYKDLPQRGDFREAKATFVHELVKWGGLDKLPKGSRVLDVGCGIGGSSRILADHYGFNVIGITISAEQVRRARELTPEGLSCIFEEMDAMNLKFKDGEFDGIWSVEAGPHMPNKQKYADEMLRVLRPGGYLAVADWNSRDLTQKPPSFLEKLVLKQLLEQWAHPSFSSINSFTQNLSNSPFTGGNVESDNWTEQTLPSWFESIYEGVRRPQVFFSLGITSFFKSFREIPTILLMHWSFAKGLMDFGVFRCRG
tara:strand:- start:1406 stop:2335 length:930 start_codon:yes stop_codon:yes gene_type:complete